MFFKKFAMFVLTMGMATGVMMTQPVTVAADETAIAVEETKDNDSENTVDEQVTAPTVIPAVTARPAVTKTPAMSEGVKKIVAGTQATSGPDFTKEMKKAKKAKKNYTKSQLRLMASIINCEAGGESFQGQVAVGIVVMNRVKCQAFPNTIKGVIYQRGQFTPARNGMLHKKLVEYDAHKTGTAQWKSCIKAAKKALNGQTTVKVKGKTRSMKGIRFFSVGLANAKFRLGGHRFK